MLTHFSDKSRDWFAHHYFWIFWTLLSERSGANRKSSGAERWAGVAEKLWSGARRGRSRSGKGEGSGCCRNRLEREAAFSPLTLRSHALLHATTVTQSACKAIEFGEITQNKGYYAVQGHSRSPMSVPIERPYATFY